MSLTASLTIEPSEADAPEAFVARCRLVNQGDQVTMHLTNIETAKDATHGFVIGGQNVSLSLEPGETETIKFTAETAGVYPFYCTEFCSALHIEMAGYFLVKPAE